MGIKMNWKKAAKQFKAARPIFENEFGDAVEEHVKEVFKETQIRVPRETVITPGTALMDSGRVEQNDKLSWSIWYGEPGEGKGIVDYAAAVHEILDARHSPPTGPKYVEGPLIESLPMATKTCAEHAERAKKRAFR